MNRRGFFGCVLGAATAARVAPRLIETPITVTSGYISVLGSNTLTGDPITVMTTTAPFDPEILARQLKQALRQNHQGIRSAVQEIMDRRGSLK